MNGCARAVASPWAGIEATVSFRCYKRSFVRPLKTAHGLWRDRQGIILKLQTPDGQRAYGEIAPIPWFGSETLAEAISLLQSLPKVVLDQEVMGQGLGQDDLGPALAPELGRVSGIAIPARYSATRFGLGMALAQFHKQLEFSAASPSEQPASICALLPTGLAALAAWPQLWEQGHRTFKWKLGVADLASEMRQLELLRRSLPAAAQLRLDANGGLTLAKAKVCLALCDRLASQGLPIEFLEQPLSPEQLDDLLILSRSYQTPLALDESVATLPQLKACYERGWREIFVIKAAIAGDPMALLSFCQAHQLDVVWSSVFETAVARQGVMAMAAALEAAHCRARDRGDGSASGPIPSGPIPSRALGFGVEHWFSTHDPEEPLGQLDGDLLWQQLSNG